MTTLNYRTIGLGLAALVWGAAGGRGWTADFHVTTAQELQNALTVAAGNGAPDTIWFAAGYYVGNFNFSSAEATDLTLQPEPGVDATQVTIDGAGTGRSLNLVCTAAANITVTNLTFVRNCGDTDNAALRISTVGADVSVGGCRFLGSTNNAGIGLEIVAGRNVAVVNCTVNRTGTATGQGITISGITTDVRVEGCTVSGPGSGNGGGISVTAEGAISIIGNAVAGTQRGIYASGASTIRGNTVTGNSDNGIYVYAVNKAATITGNTLTGNSSGSFGGGIYAGGTITITRNSFTGNSASQSYGGGAICASGTVRISDNTFTGNSAGYGGAIAFPNFGGSSAATISSNIFIGNSAGGGGAIATLYSGTVTINANRIFRNRASTSYGGGIHASGTTLKINNNFIAGNSALSASRGGGIYLEPSSRLEFINNTATGNSSSGVGGGVAISISGVTEQLYAYNNILWGNTATGNGKDVWLAGTGQRKEFLYNNAHDLYGVWDIAQNNIDLAPLFYDPLHDDYHLRFGSPGIDAGTNAVAMLPAMDIDGEARLINTAPDLGADEFNNQDYHPADANNDWVIDDAEYTAYAAAWKNDQTWIPGPVPIPADFVTRAGYLKENGGAYHNTGGPKPVCWKRGAP